MTDTAQRLIATFDRLPDEDRRSVASEILRRSIKLLLHPVSADQDSTMAKTTRRYSFIGIARSGRNDLSSRADDILAESADRRSGWRLPE